MPMIVGRLAAGVVPETVLYARSSAGISCAHGGHVTPQKFRQNPAPTQVGEAHGLPVQVGEGK